MFSVCTIMISCEHYVVLLAFVVVRHDSHRRAAIRLIGGVCDCVCLCVSTLKAKRLELPIPDLVYV